MAFLPLPDGGYLLGHDRDESVKRPQGLLPRRHRRAKRAFLCPRDPQGKGTWIGVNDAGVTLCVLNAADRDPSRLPAEPLSRGRVLWELLHHDSIESVRDFLSEEQDRLWSVRAFHLVAAVPGSAVSTSAHAEGPGRSPRAARFRWDGLHLTEDDHDGPSLFVSSGYDQGAAEGARSESWRRLLATHPFPEASSLAAFLTGHEPERGPLSACMHREEARTVSRTMVTVEGGLAIMAYHDGQPCDAAAPETTYRLRLKA